MPFISGRGFEDLMVVNLARYKPSGEYVTVRRVNLEACTNEMVTFLQVTWTKWYHSVSLGDNRWQEQCLLILYSYFCIYCIGSKYRFCFQGELHVSKLFNHPNIVPYKATFIADNELWVVTSFMAYGKWRGCIFVWPAYPVKWSLRGVTRLSKHPCFSDQWRDVLFHFRFCKRSNLYSFYGRDEWIGYCIYSSRSIESTWLHSPHGLCT